MATKICLHHRRVKPKKTISGFEIPEHPLTVRPWIAHRWHHVAVRHRFAAVGTEQFKWGGHRPRKTISYFTYIYTCHLVKWRLEMNSYSLISGPQKSSKNHAATSKTHSDKNFVLHRRLGKWWKTTDTNSASPQKPDSMENHVGDANYASIKILPVTCQYLGQWRLVTDLYLVNPGLSWYRRKIMSTTDAGAISKRWCNWNSNMHGKKFQPFQSFANPDQSSKDWSAVKTTVVRVIRRLFPVFAHFFARKPSPN